MRRLVMAVALFLAAGCGGVFWPYSVKPFADEFAGTRGVAMRNNEIPGPALENGRLFIDVLRVDRDSLPPQFTLQVRYIAPDWMFVERGESLVFLADGDRIRLSGDGSAASREVSSAGGIVTVYEQATYVVEPQALVRIGSANEVRLRLSGRSRTLERTLSPENRARFREFIQQHGQ